MKKIFAFVILLIQLFATVVCADIAIDTKRIDLITGRDGVTYLVDENSYTISDSLHEYKFSVTGSGEGETIEITYPDGSTYYESGNGVSYSIGWSDDYIAFTKDNEKNYAPGEILCEVYRSDNPVRERKSVLPAIICFILGILSLLAPELAWYLQYGWRFKDAEPSDAALIIERIVGGIILVMVILYFII